MFNKAIEKEVDVIKEDPTAKAQLLKDVLVKFYRFELENGKAIRDCVERFRVPRQWILNVDLNESDVDSCEGTELSFLTNPAKSHCLYSWISNHHRSKFYQKCLAAFPINSIRKKALSATRNMENLASLFKTEMLDRGAHKVGGGSTMIAGGVLGGIGLLLSATGPIGISLVIGGALLGASGSIATMFGKHSDFSIQEAELQMTQLKDTHDSISSLLTLYGEAAKNLKSFEETFAAQCEEVLDRVQTNYGVLLNVGLNTGKTGIAGKDILLMRKVAKSSILSRVVQRMFNTKEIVKAG